MLVKKLSWALVALMSLPAANATTIIYSSPGKITAIGGLDIGGTLYDVDFESGAYSTFGGAVLFWDNAGDASAARDTIVGLLDAIDVDGPQTRPVLTTTPAQIFQVQHTGSSTSYIGECRDTDTGFFCGNVPVLTTQAWLDGGTGARNALTATAWSLTTVPVPAAVWLFGSALGLLSWMRRRK